MEGGDVCAFSRPNGLAAGLGQEPDPDHHVISVGAQRMGRAYAIQWQIQKKAIEIGVVKRAVTQNDRDVSVEPVGIPTFLNRDGH
jgi:hypothetical protein